VGKFTLFVLAVINTIYYGMAWRKLHKSLANSTVWHFAFAYCLCIPIIAKNYFAKSYLACCPKKGTYYCYKRKIIFTVLCVCSSTCICKSMDSRFFICCCCSYVVYPRFPNKYKTRIAPFIKNYPLELLYEKVRTAFQLPELT